MNTEESKNETQKQQLGISDVSNNEDYKIWDDLFGILSWKFKVTKSGDVYLDGESVFNELKDKFELKRK